MTAVEIFWNQLKYIYIMLIDAHQVWKLKPVQHLLQPILTINIVETKWKWLKFVEIIWNTLNFYHSNVFFVIFIGGLVCIKMRQILWITFEYMIYRRLDYTWFIWPHFHQLISFLLILNVSSSFKPCHPISTYFQKKDKFQPCSVITFCSDYFQHFELISTFFSI